MISSMLDGLLELDLPLPAVSVEAGGGYRLWFALAEGIDPATCERFLGALQRHFLAEVPVDRIDLTPIGTLPIQLGERWSAFIDPTLGSLFTDSDGLDFPPDPERQSALLATVDALSPAVLKHALAQLDTADAPTEPPPSASDTFPLGAAYTDPKAFLLAVMNDPRIAAAHRIAAAQALLPYCHRPAGD